MGGMLAAFHDEIHPIRQNRLLFDWLRDDCQRAALYDELRARGCPVMRFKSLLRKGGSPDQWPNEDVYLLSGTEDIKFALQHYSVKPYSELASAGRFMLGLDDRKKHDEQNQRAVSAMRFTAHEIDSCLRVASFRGTVLPLKQHRFDLPTELAEQVALRFVGLLFGLPDAAHLFLERYMRGAYRQLSFQIIGRHFVSDSGLPPAKSVDSVRVEDELKEYIREARTLETDERLREPGLPKESVITRLVKAYGEDELEEVVLVALGLISGTVGNVQAAVSIAIEDFFTRRDVHGSPLIDRAREAARGDDEGLEALVMQALARTAPAPFLARTSIGTELTFTDRAGRSGPIPEGAHILIAIGVAVDSCSKANESLVFGGPSTGGFLHRCIGETLARQLTFAIVRQVLLLPGLSQVIDPETAQPLRLTKRWGAICERYPLQYQRDRRLNQQPLFVVLKIKPPVRKNAGKLKRLIEAGAHIVEKALRDSRNVHFAWFNLIDNDTHLVMATVFDGDFDAYVEHFAVEVPLFDEQFKLLEDAPPLPISEHPKEFVETIRKYNRAPVGNYFYSAYPAVSVADVANATDSRP